MKERGILFSGEMVRALLDGRKTQTRRIIKFPRWADPASGILFLGGCPSPMVVESGFSHWRQLPAPYAVGDILYVKETHAFPREAATQDRSQVLYRADDPMYDGMGPGDIAWKWRPSIFMPRWASRITLEVTAVRAERLQDISEEDAKAEGIATDSPESSGFRNYLGGAPAFSARESFQSLWASINGAGSWDANPWVWVYGLRRVEC